MSKQHGTDSEEYNVAYDTITLCELMNMTINTILNKYYLIRYIVCQTIDLFLVCSVYISLRNKTRKLEHIFRFIFCSVLMI